MNARELEDWKEADRYLSRLLQLPQDQWTIFIGGLEITPEVRHRLELLITANAGTGPLDGEMFFCGQPAIEKNLLSGTELGGWQLDEEIGRGGMAVVYRAHRLGVDFRQTAAIKLLPRGTAGHAHFRREQAVLAQLEHPYIARFLDGGVAGDGTPWLAMEVVEGERLDQAVHTMDDEGIVAMILRVIDAVAFAHRHLVVHRDLKPSNVLVDAEGRPRLLDFGIAKLLNEESEAAATRLLTPEYAAPEQFAGAPISTATDVYGLGAILHALLAGAPPRDRSGQRQMELTRSIHDGDLRCIIEKALRDGPLDRYATAQALGADLQRWQENQPVEARPDSRRYRLRKWLVRHRNAAVAGAAMLILAIASVSAVLWQANQTAQQARTVAAQNAVLTELLASPQLVARGRRVKVVEILEEAPELIKSNMSEPSAGRADLLANLAQTLDQLGRSDAAVDLWQKAVADLDATAPDERRRQLAYRLGLARAMIGSENYAGAIDLLESLADRARAELSLEDELHASIAIRQYYAQRLQGTTPAADALQAALEAGESVEWQTDRAKGEYECGRLQILVDSGQFAEAVELATGFRDWARETLGDRHASTLCGFQAGVTAMSRAGHLETAATWAREGEIIASEWLGEDDMLAFQLRNARANVLEQLGRFDEAIELHQSQIARRDRIAGLTAEERIIPVQGLAVAYLESGRYEEAESLMAEVVDHARQNVGPAAPRTLMAMANQAELLLFAGKSEAAWKPAEEAHSGLVAALGPEHPVSQFARSILGGVHGALGRTDQALELLQSAPTELAAAFGKDDINVVNAKAWLAGALFVKGRSSEAADLAAQALSWREERLGPQHPRTEAVRALLTRIHDRSTQAALREQ